jgi:hypothetical protein
LNFSNIFFLLINLFIFRGLYVQNIKKYLESDKELKEQITINKNKFENISSNVNIDEINELKKLCYDKKK